MIVGVSSAFASGCVRLAILSYHNAHAHTVLPWRSHVTDGSGAHAPALPRLIPDMLERSADQWRIQRGIQGCTGTPLLATPRTKKYTDDR